MADGQIRPSTIPRTVQWGCGGAALRGARRLLLAGGGGCPGGVDGAVAVAAVPGVAHDVHLPAAGAGRLRLWGPGGPPAGPAPLVARHVAGSPARHPPPDLRPP